MPGPASRLLVVVQLDSAAAVGWVATDRSIRRGAAVSTCAPARRPEQAPRGRQRRRPHPGECETVEAKGAELGDHLFRTTPSDRVLRLVRIDAAGPAALDAVR